MEGTLTISLYLDVINNAKIVAMIVKCRQWWEAWLVRGSWVALCSMWWTSRGDLGLRNTSQDCKSIPGFSWDNNSEKKICLILIICTQVTGDPLIMILTCHWLNVDGNQVVNIVMWFAFRKPLHHFLASSRELIQALTEYWQSIVCL